MRAVPLLLAIVASPAVSLAAPATVLEHHLVVDIDRRGAATTRVEWTVRIDDPAACAAGLYAPAGLEGATDAGARVLGDLLVVPADVAAGAVFSLVSVKTSTAPGYSGVFATAPDLPVTRASVRITAVPRVPLSVWTDPDANPQYGPNRAATVSWTDLPEDGGARLAWSTWPDWSAAGGAFAADHSVRLGSRADLGRDLASGMEGLGVGGVVARVRQRVSVYPGDYGDYADVRPAAEVLASGAGTAAERAVVLASALKIGGFDAHLAAYRPADGAADTPLVVPSPALFDRPAVAVRAGGRVIWIDPASDYTEVPNVPAAMRGGIAWLPGDLPVRVGTIGLYDGEVRIVGQGLAAADGTLGFDATLTASGSASEWLRSLLAPLDADARTEVVLRLVRQARPDVERVVVAMTGVESADRALRINIQTSPVMELRPFGTGFSGEVPSLLAPALAAWLPPNLLVREELSLTAPTGMAPLAAEAPPADRHDDAVVSRAIEHDVSAVRVVTEAVRPYRTSTSARDQSADAFLRAAGRHGAEILLFPPIDPAGAKVIRRELSAGAAAAFATEVALWTRGGDPRRARKALQQALLAVPPLELLPELARRSDPGDPRALAFLGERIVDDETRLALAEAYEARACPREAWLTHASLIRSPDADVRVSAYLGVRRLQPAEAPSAIEDPLGHQSWFDPTHLRGWAEETAAQSPRTPEVGDPRLVRLDAEDALAAGKVDEAEVLFARAMRADDDPTLAVWLARSSSSTRVDTEETIKAIEAAIRLAPHDPDVLAVAAEGLAELEAHRLALDVAVAAARVSFDDPERWSDVVGYAFRAGDLPTAASAARRASDVDRTDRARAETAARLAALTGDAELAAVAAVRLGRAPAPPEPFDVDATLTAVPLDQLGAVLAFHDEAVRASPAALALRSQLRLAAGERADAARDGLLLHTRHQDPRGAAVAFAAAAGTLWSTALEDLLDAAAAHPQAAATRLDWTLVSGSRNTAQIARSLSGNPHADALVAFLDAPATVANEQVRWPLELPPPTGVTVPPGHVANAVLSAAPGVKAWSHPIAGTALLAIGRAQRALPPPLSLFASLREPALSTMTGGGRVFRVDGLQLPLFAAFKVKGDVELIGLGFTPESAERVVRQALGG
jgi:tetratricopeptide (TPR) repeat protein